MAVELFDDISELGTDEVSAVRRQTRASGSKTKWRGNRGRRTKLLLVCGMIVIGAGAAYSAIRFARDAPFFRMASVEVQGGKFVSALEVEDQFAADKDRGVLRVPLERRRRQVEQIPWVRAATVRRVLPDKIVVAVTERVPVAFLAGQDGICLVDEDGVVLDAPRDSAFRFPVVRGVAENEPAASRREKMRLFAAVMNDLQRGGLQSSASISEVDLQDGQDARVVVSDSSGTVLLHLGKEDFLARYLIYLNRIAEWKQRFANIQSVDLRYEGQVVINADPQRELNAPRQGIAPPVSKSPGPPQAR